MFYEELKMTVTDFDYQTENGDNLSLVLTCFHHICEHTHTHTHTHPFNGPLSGTTGVSQYQKGKTDLDFTEARDSE